MESVEDKTALVSPCSANSAAMKQIYTAKDLKEWMNVDQFDDSQSCKELACGVCSGLKEACSCSRTCLLQKLNSWFPIIDAFKTYKIKKFLLSDFIAGLTVGIMHIPQGMGFALLAGLPPVIGLYTSFFPVVMYFLFTPSRSTSFGSQSLVCLMLGSLLERECIDAGLCSSAALDTGQTTASGLQTSDNNMTYELTTSDQITAIIGTSMGDDMATTAATSGADDNLFTPDVQFKISLAVTLAFLIGVIQMLMSLLRLGVISLYFSATFISACNCGAAFQIATTQIKFLLGLRIPPPSGRFGLVKTWVSVLQAWRMINVADIIASIISIVVMVLVKKLINEKYKDKLKIPIPIEILVVVLSTAVSKAANLSELVGLNVVGSIPQGIPPPALPQFSKIQAQTVFDAIPIALIGFLSAVLMAKMFANKYEYKVDINQELFANGIANTFSSFFTCFPSSVAPPRTMLFDSVGGKTQIAYIFSCSLVLSVLVLIGPLFQTLPTSVLAAIIVVALIPLFEGMKDVTYLWRVNRLDFLVWVGTITAVIVIDLGPGIVIGVLFSIISVVLHTQAPQAYVTLPVKDTDIFLSREICQSVNTLSKEATAVSDRIVVFKFDCPLYYANYECFVNKLTAILMPHILKIKESGMPNGNPDKADLRRQNAHEMEPLNDNNNNLLVILDFSSIHYVDVVGLKILKVIHTKLSHFKIKLVISGFTVDVLKTLERGDVLRVYGEENLFFSVNDAILKHTDTC